MSPLTLNFQYTTKEGGSLNIVPTTSFPTSGTVTIKNKYRYLTDDDGNQIGYLLVSSSSVYNLNSNYVTVENGTYSFNDGSAVSYQYSYPTNAEGTFPAVINKFPVLTASGNYLCYKGYITVTVQPDSVRDVKIKLFR